MIVLAAVDDNNGLMFNKRRQSQDRVLRDYILNLTRDSRLWMNDYTGKQFHNNNFNNYQDARIEIDNDFMEKVGPGEYCWIENISVKAFENKIEKVILFKWNRKYPGDFFFDLDLLNPIWKLSESEDFPGNSHEKITKEVYIRV